MCLLYDGCLCGDMASLCLLQESDGFYSGLRLACSHMPFWTTTVCVEMVCREGLFDGFFFQVRGY